MDLSHTGLPCLDLEKPDIGNQWQRWKRAFQIFIDAKGITEPGRQKALLLHCAGMAVQDIYFSLPEEKIKLPPLPETASAQELIKREKVEYQMAIEALEEHFQPKVNVTYERHVFRGMRQEREENMNNFIARLRKQAQNCDFQKQVEDQIKDQVISACYSSELRREFLHKSEITLAEIEKLSKTFEAVAIHSKALDGEEAQCSRVIMKRPQKKFYKGRDKQTSSKINTNVCYRCGRAGHFRNDPSCPARDKICNKCKMKGHFAGMCHTQLKKRKPHISQVQTKEAPSSDSGSSVFRLSAKGNDEPFIKCSVGGVPLQMLIDSGAGTSVIDKEAWTFLKHSGVNFRNASKVNKEQRGLFPYGQRNSLTVLGYCDVEIRIRDRREEERIYIVKEKGDPLLGRRVAQKLGVLRVGLEAIQIKSVKKREIEKN
ncbi:uncharacterized protein [Rhodnius prolixus]|uniref:uncharacterized protein n=1 Tax=Rhodnius prolixus TaxID=13249 RepID=UPI003D189FCD